MQTSFSGTDSYAKVIANSKRVRWDIERDVIRGRRFDLSKPFLPTGLSLVGRARLPDARDRRLLSQVQGRSYAYIFGLVERFIGAKVLEISRAARARRPGRARSAGAHDRRGDSSTRSCSAASRSLMAADMPAGYVPTAEPNAVAAAVLGKSTWSVLALTLRHRAVHAGALPRQHRAARRPLRAVEGRVPVPLEGGVAARDARRARVPARGRAARRRRARRRPSAS